MTVNVNVLLLVCVAWSVTVMVYTVDPDNTVGVPVIAPDVELRLKPAGKLGLTL